MTQAALHKTTAESVKEECKSAVLPVADPVSGIISYNDLVAFGIRQTSNLELCEGKRELAEDSDTIHNDYVDRLLEMNEELERSRRSWWERLLP